MKTPMKTDKVVMFVDNKNRNNKDTKKSHKKKFDSSNIRKTMTSKTDSVAEIQVSDSNTSTDIEYNDSI